MFFQNITFWYNCIQFFSMSSTIAEFFEGFDNDGACCEFEPPWEERMEYTKNTTTNKD